MTLFESPPPKRYDDPFSRVRRARRRRGLWWLWVVSGVLAGAFTLWSWFGPAGGIFSPNEPPSAESIALADRGFFTETAREIWYEASPQLTDVGAVSAACKGPSFFRTAAATADDGSVSLGCYVRTAGREQIFVYDPQEERLAAVMITTGAHEMLHAAYERIPAEERTELDALTAAEVAKLAPEHPVHLQIAGSVRGREMVRGTEHFAYLGTQIMPEGGFDPRLEEIYARYFTDRAALVGAYAQNEAMMKGVVSELEAGYVDLETREAANVTEQAQLDADRQTHQFDVDTYNADSSRYNALPPAERAQWTETLTYPDGRIETLPWEESLARRLGELDARRSSIEQRQAALTQAQTDASVLRADLEGRYNDAVRLFEAAYPSLDGS